MSVGRIRIWVTGLSLALSLHAGRAAAVSVEEFGAMEPDQALRLPATEALPVFGWSAREFRFVLENSLIDLRYLYQAPSGRPSAGLSAAV